MDYPGEPDLITQVLKSEEHFLAAVMGRCDYESMVRDADGGRGAHVKECGLLLEDRKCEQTYSSLKFQERNVVLITP